MKKIITLTIFSLLLQKSFAQVKVNNELKQLILQSFTYFPKVSEAENAISTATEKIKFNQLANSPSVVAIGSYTFIQPVAKVIFPVNGVDKAFQFQPEHNLYTNLNANYTIADFGRLKATIERAKDDILYAKHNVENVKFQLATQVASIYYSICYLQQAIIVQDSILNVLEENKKIVTTKLADGDGLKLDLLNIQANIDNELNRKIDLTNSLQKQQRLLNYTTGSESITGDQFDFDIVYSPINDTMVAFIDQQPDFLLIKDKIQQTKHEIAITTLQDKPMVNLNAGAGFRNGIQPDIAAFKFNYLAGISLVVPIYTGGKTKQQVRLQQTLLKQQELSLNSLQHSYKKDIQQAYLDISSAVSRIENTKGQIDQAKYAEQLASFRYKNGVGTNLEFMNAVANVQRATLTKLQYQYQLCVTKIELAKLLGEKYW
jgi:outer membrane protein